MSLLTPSPDWRIITSPRVTAYCAEIDPDHESTGDSREDDYEGTFAYREIPEGKLPNLVLSLREDGLHSPCLDIDYEQVDESDTFMLAAVFDYAPVIWVPSASHWHAYLPGVAYEWDDYCSRLDMLTGGKYPMLEDGYVSASEVREFTAVRPPWAPKRKDDSE